MGAATVEVLKMKYLVFNFTYVHSFILSHFYLYQRFDRFHCDIKKTPVGRVDAKEKVPDIKLVADPIQSSATAVWFSLIESFFRLINSSLFLIETFSTLFIIFILKLNPRAFPFPHTTFTSNHSLFAIHIREFISYSKQASKRAHPTNGWNGNEKWNASRYLEHVCKFTYKNFDDEFMNAAYIFSLLLNRNIVAQVLFVLLKLKNG